MSMLKRFLTGSRFDAKAHDLYDVIVPQARQPVFYASLGIPDTTDGRFDLVLLHAQLVIRRLRRCGEAGRILAQRLFDLMFADFDEALRLLGVGDLKVGPRVKKMAQAYYGRAQAYDAALDAGDEAALAHALRRNLYRSESEPDGLAAITAYVVAQERHLAALADADLLAGHVSFAPGPLPVAEQAAI